MKKVFTSTKVFFQGVYQEIQKVVWPSRKTVINHTIIVIIVSVVVMIVVSIIDFGLSKAFEYFLSLKKG